MSQSTSREIIERALGRAQRAGADEVDAVFVEGDDVTDVLSYVQYERRDLTERVRKLIEQGLRNGRINLEDSALLRRRYHQGLADYTYLRDEN